jgi:hypothetical protein
MTPDATVVIASYPARHRADAIVEGLLRNKIPAMVVRALRRARAWDVVVLAGDVDRARAVIKGLGDD